MGSYTARVEKTIAACTKEKAKGDGIRKERLSAAWKLFTV